MEKRANNILKKCKQAGYYLIHAMIGCCIIVVLSFLTLIGFFRIGCFTYDALILNTIVMFIIPFSVGAIYFRAVFRLWNHRALVITPALLISWIAQNSMIYGIEIWNLSQLLFRISKGEHETSPWFTIEYIILTLLGCIVLGFIVSKRKKEPLNQTGQL